LYLGSIVGGEFMLSIIAAMAKNNVLGFQNTLPWHLPAELAYFKKITLGKAVIMGRKTFESIGKPLPQRKNIVISQGLKTVPEGVLLYRSFEAALASLQTEPALMVIGGAEIYRQAIPFADRMYLTFIELACQGDVFFPVWDPQDWHLSEEQYYTADEKNPYPYVTRIFDRK
jgi:dihydrofolate reductase